LNAAKEFGRHEGATLFMTLMAGFQALLARYSGQERIVVGTDVANRVTPETEQMIGFFINLLPVATDLSGNPTFRQLIGRVRDGLLEAYGHQEVPFAKIVQELQPERSSAHNPIVQVLFVMQNVPRPKPDIAGLKLEGFEIPVRTSKFDIGVFMVEKADKLLGYWVYSTDLFDQQRIQRMAGHFERLLRGAIQQPDEPISALEIFSSEEKGELEAGRKQRKLSHLQKLMATAPEVVGISAKEEDKR
jgi:non-ribosomal peptide synthetase component F